MSRIEDWAQKAKVEFEELSEQFMEAYEKWDTEEGAIALGWHTRVSNILQEYPE